MRTIFILFIWVVTLIIPISDVKCYDVQNDIDPNNFETIQSVVIYTMLWSIMTNGSLSPYDMLNMPNKTYVKVHANDKMMRRQLNELLKDLVPTKISYYNNVRTVCLLYRKDGVDTLSFGNFDFCELNSKQYKLVTRKGVNLVEFIMEYLPYIQVKDILEMKKYWLINLKKNKK